ncbi:MAG: DUF222 domain-containing protein [Vicinamibacterales bacterium]
MTCTALAESPAVVSIPVPAVVALEDSPPCHSTASTDETRALGESIALLAARLHAATYELLVMLGEFDRRGGWNEGFLSCAHWLHWRTGIDLGAAREKVRVARVLVGLPIVSDQMRRGQLSYAKVRALTRVATPSNEESLVHLALAGTAAQVERFVRAWRRVDRAQEARETEARHLRRELSIWTDEDGMVVIRGRLTPEAGAVVQRALEAAADRLFREARSAVGGTLSEEVSTAQRRADALALLAESALSAGLDTGTAGDRYQVVLHVSARESTADIEAHAGLQPDRAVGVHSDAGGVLELDPGAFRVSAETSRRFACDASIVRMQHDASGAVLDVGRRTRTVPPAIRRALAARDTTCRFPGCTSRRCDAHHIEHWADGGPTRLDNLLRLCRRHHRAVHEGGFAVVRRLDGTLEFLTPGGAILPASPPLPEVGAAGLSRAATSPPPVWDGTPFDVTWAIDVLYSDLHRRDDGRGRSEGAPHT